MYNGMLLNNLCARRILHYPIFMDKLLCFSKTEEPTYVRIKFCFYFSQQRPQVREWVYTKHRRQHIITHNIYKKAGSPEQITTTQSERQREWSRMSVNERYEMVEMKQ
jgi:hypothetical protein